MIRFNHYSNEMFDLPANVHCKGDVNVPGPTPEEQALQKQQLELIQEQRAQNEMLKPYLYQLAGIKEVDGRIVAMTEDEQLASMTSAQRLQYDNSKLQAEQYQKALKGELPLSQAVENEISKRWADTQAYLSRKLGPQWEESTPGIQSKAEFDKWSSALREEQQTGKLSGASAMSIAQQDFYNQLLGRSAQSASSPLGMYQGLMGSYQAALQPYQIQRQMQLQANMSNARSGNSMMSGLGMLAGTGLGSAVGGPGGAMLGSKIAGLIGPSFNY